MSVTFITKVFFPACETNVVRISSACLSMKCARVITIDSHISSGRNTIL